MLTRYEPGLPEYTRTRRPDGEDEVGERGNVPRRRSGDSEDICHGSRVGLEGFQLACDPNHTSHSATVEVCTGSGGKHAIHSTAFTQAEGPDEMRLYIR